MTANTPQSEKALIRAKMTALRESMAPGEAAALSAAITARILANPAVIAANAVYIYISVKGEPDTSAIITALRSSGKSVFAPVVISKTEMIFCPLPQDAPIERTRENKFGIPEPPLTREAPQIYSKSANPVFIIPCVAVSIRGARIGYGGGYYDRYLGSVMGSCRKIALAYSFSLLEEIPTCSTDVYMDEIITESETILIHQ